MINPGGKPDVAVVPFLWVLPLRWRRMCGTTACVMYIVPRMLMSKMRS